jgi:hypothetical protein
MRAQVFTIVSKDKTDPALFPSPWDFSLIEEGTIPFQKILKNPMISLYCLDPINNNAIFVKTSPDIYLNEFPFYAGAQYQHAVQVIKTSYDTLHQLADQIDLDERRLILIYNVGRSGTTVTSAAFDQVENVISFSEPDVFSQLVEIRDFSGKNDALISKLTAACMRLTCKQSVLYPQLIWAIKFRSQACDLADLICQSFPAAKCLFLYRNAKAWFDSYMRAFGGHLSPEQIRDSWSWCKSTIRMIAAYPISDPKEINAGLMMGLMWLNNMDICYQMIEAGRPILPVRYEDLKADPLPVMGKIFDYCGVPPANQSALAEVFATDSQAGTGIARDQISQKKWDFDPGLLENLRQVIAEHPVIRTPDFILPGTLSL